MRKIYDASLKPGASTLSREDLTVWAERCGARPNEAQIDFVLSKANASSASELSFSGFLAFYVWQTQVSFRETARDLKAFDIDVVSCNLIGSVALLACTPLGRCRSFFCGTAEAELSQESELVDVHRWTQVPHNRFCATYNDLLIEIDGPTLRNILVELIETNNLVLKSAATLPAGIGSAACILSNFSPLTRVHVIGAYHSSSFVRSNIANFKNRESDVFLTSEAEASSADLVFVDVAQLRKLGLNNLPNMLPSDLLLSASCLLLRVDSNDNDIDWEPVRSIFQSQPVYKFEVRDVLGSFKFVCNLPLRAGMKPECGPLEPFSIHSK